jgi:hypothetical protein
MNPTEVLRRLIAALDHAGIAYMLSGSLAAAYYGTSRSTQDIDFVIEATAEQLQAFVRHLPTDEYYVDLNAALEAHRQRSLFNLIDLSSGWKVDLIIRKDRPFSREEFGRRQLVRIEGLSLFMASPEDMIIAKLEWSKLGESHRQIEDVAGILRVRGESVDRAYVEKWAQDLQLQTQWKQALETANLSR